MVRGGLVLIAAAWLGACSPAPLPADGGASSVVEQPLVFPAPDPQVLRFDPGATFRLRVTDERGRLRLLVVLREARTGAALEVTDYPPRGARPRSDPPMVLSRITPLTRAQVAAFWSSLEAAQLWTAPADVPRPGAMALELEARLGGRARAAAFSAEAPLAGVVTAVRNTAQVEELERHAKPRVAAIEGPPAESIAVVSDPTRVVLVQDSPDGDRLTIVRDGDLVRVTRRLPLVRLVGRRHRRWVQWLQRDRWLPRDALEEALARATAAGLWELRDPASSSPSATRLILHTEAHDLVLATPPGPDPLPTAAALAPLRALSP